MEQKVLDMIQQFNLLQKGDNVIVALSGGADSMALFHFMLQYRERLGIHVAAAHFEHGLREETSLQDAVFVQELCDKNGIILYIQHGNMRQQKKPQGMGVEAWARELRYAFLRQIAQENNAKVALAHTLSDNAETVLFHAARGAGPRGLAGIAPVRDCFIRPMLRIDRREVEAYCKRFSLAYRNDETNEDLTYSRNRLRHETIPSLEKAHAGATHALARLAEDMRVLSVWLEDEAEKYLEQARDGKEGYRAAVLLQAPQPVRLYALSQLCGPQADRSALERVERLLQQKTGLQQLAGGKYALLHKGKLFVGGEDLCLNKNSAQSYEYSLREGIFRLPGGYVFCVQVCSSCEEWERIKKTAVEGLTFVADYDKIKNGIFRPRREGDCFAPLGRHVTKTLKKWMNEEGILPAKRGNWPLLADGNHILWVYGFGFAEGTTPSVATRNYLVIQTIKEEDYAKY